MTILQGVPTQYVSFFVFALSITLQLKDKGKTNSLAAFCAIGQERNNFSTYLIVLSTHAQLEHLQYIV